MVFLYLKNSFTLYYELEHLYKKLSTPTDHDPFDTSNPDNNYDKDFADDIKRWVGGFASARNFDEAGTAVGKAFRDAANWIGRGLGSIFGGGGASAPVLNVISNASQQASVFGANYIGTIATNNLTFGLVQTPYAFTGTNLEGAERLGRYAGDITTMLQGAIEDIGAGFGEVLSLGFATVPAGAVAIHGSALAGVSAYAGLAEARGFADYFARDRSGSSSGRPKMGNNGTKNEEVTSLVKKYNLDKINQRKLHDYITRQNYSRSDIEKIIRNREYLMK